MYSRAWGNSSLPAPLRRSRKSTFASPKNVTPPPRSADAKTTLPKTSSALGAFFSPSAAEIKVTEPTPSSSPNAMTKTMNGKETLMAARPMGPTIRPTNMRSTKL